MKLSSYMLWEAHVSSAYEGECRLFLADMLSGHPDIHTQSWSTITDVDTRDDARLMTGFSSK